ncbi:hypothetical protein [Bacteroides sp. UBA939]|uniref:hypothetical protein n=1 Tax=Bacteroides sp. UBA939 TaxID=1946092 RepID=UPI0025C727B5|nr:hypothetical protein [Bacteroides sp. UBA939]
MNTLFKNILVKESDNDTSVHLYYFAESDIWKAYEESAMRLMNLIPMLKAALHEVNIPGLNVLRCVDIDLNRKEHHNAILQYCISMSDDYMELAV